MKKLIFSLLLVLGCAWQLFAQQADTTKSEAHASSSGDDQKTMNRQQTLANYLQAEARNLTSTSKGVQLKATIFALNPKDSASKYKDNYYLTHTWQRYTQWTAGGGTDKNNNINAFNVGLSYDILNHRDLSLINIYKETKKQYKDQLPSITKAINGLRNSELEKYITAKDKILENEIYANLKEAYTNSDTVNIKVKLIAALVPLPQQRILNKDKTFGSLFDKVQKGWKLGVSVAADPDIYTLADYVSTIYFLTPLNDALTSYLNYAAKNGKEQKGASQANVDTAEFNDLLQAINQDIKTQQGTLHGKNVVAVYTYLDTLFKQESNYLAGRGSVVLGYNFMHASTGISTQHAFSLVWLRGIGGPTSRRLWELSFTAADTIATDTVNKAKPLARNIGTAQLGINRVLFTDVNSVSLLEANLAAEGDHVFLDKYQKENENKEYATLTLQGRPSAKSVWFKVAVKYGGKSNFLGFLDVTLSLDNSSGKTSN